MSKEKVARVLGPDGVARPAEVEKKLNAMFAQTFSTPAAAQVLDHLRSISMHWVHGPNSSDAELRQREGMRFLYYVIEQRVLMGKAE